MLGKKKKPVDVLESPLISFPAAITQWHFLAETQQPHSPIFRCFGADAYTPQQVQRGTCSRRDPTFSDLLKQVVCSWTRRVMLLQQSSLQ